MVHIFRLTLSLPTITLIQHCINHTESVLAASMVIQIHHSTIQLHLLEFILMEPTALQRHITLAGIFSSTKKLKCLKQFKLSFLLHFPLFTLTLLENQNFKFLFKSK